MLALLARGATGLFSTAILIAWTMAGAAHAQTTLTGKWQGETDGGAALVLDLTANGTELTGTLTRDGVSTPVAEGKIATNTFSFKATLGGETEAISGELAGDQVKVWLDRQGPSRAIVLTRVKPGLPD